MKRIRKIIVVLTIFVSIFVLSSCGNKNKSIEIGIEGYGEYYKIEKASGKNRYEETRYEWHGGEGFKPYDKMIISWSADNDVMIRESYSWDSKNNNWVGTHKTETIYTKSDSKENSYNSKTIYYHWNSNDGTWAQDN